jgi:hypothetical protein
MNVSNTKMCLDISILTKVLWIGGSNISGYLAARAGIYEKNKTNRGRSPCGIALRRKSSKRKVAEPGLEHAT